MNDDELLAQLRAADPAPLSNAPEPDIDRLLEATMSTETDARPAPETPDGSPRGSRRRWLPAVAAGVLLAAGGLVWGLTAGQGDNHPVAGAPTATTSTSTTPSPATDRPLKLTVGDGAAGKCRAVEVADLRRLQTAFAGTVTAIQGELVTLKVDHWYRGGTATTVEVQSDADAVTTLLGVEFKVGGTYLVTATNAQVSICGESGPDSPELRDLYQKAYAG
ncbi:hypothetical protein [Streptomyces sp. SID13031]|uniref:hypothetical protein n=1 Tax=Streptomyces sp. SID13031 TaxID=2706046 RepID=UPI0013CB6FD1|nr:hypothetical protein [Streptomyces sp. SID13031]NEA32968.1 hypothetical protein [Streptomyces sp. SID13031]